jgi:lysophospholipase L1-like esterase
MKKEVLLAAGLLAAPLLASAQIIDTGGACAQDFDTLPRAGAGHAWKNNKTLPGWHAAFARRGGPDTFRADAGGGSVGIVSYGADGSPDRALGLRVSANSGDLAVGLRLVNRTGAAITSLTVTYDGEQWREDGPTPATLQFSYKVNGGLLTGGAGWTPVEQLNFTSPRTVAGGGDAKPAARPLDGNAPENRRAGITATFPVLAADGDEIWLRWLSRGVRASAQGVAIDNLAVTAATAPLSEALKLAAVDAPARRNDPPPAPEPDPYWPADDAFPGTGRPVGKGRFKDWNHQLRAGFAKLRDAEQGALVFAGDSITERWRTLAQDFAPLGVKIANRGIGGDRARNLLYRLDDDVLALHPRGLVLLIGTNDLGAMDTAADIAANIKAIIAKARARDAALPVALCLVMPRNGERDFPRRIPELNHLLREIAGAAGGDITLCDLYTPFAQEDGTSQPEYFGDRLHPNAAGYARMRDALLPALQAWSQKINH